ncbi:MAG: helix-turn-helix transcriptional regulator [Chitinophagaceae bacterium]|nr:helix-turn-helix transcriptional regulator [Chitinophagaceae bacterium]
MKPENVIIAHNVKLLRNLSKETQGEFGKRVGASQQNIVTYESGQFRPKPGILLELAKIAGVTPETLISVKLKTDKSGKITNLPDRDKELNRLRSAIQDILENNRKYQESMSKKVMDLLAEMQQLTANQAK